VTIAGSLQSEVGCRGDWQPDCAASHLTYDANDDVWQGVWAMPAGSYEYKAALNDSWIENYGQHAAPGGANIPIPLAAAGSVKFYYDHKSHWATDNKTAVIATVPGSFQSELGCAGDWDPGCLRSWLQDIDGDGIYNPRGDRASGRQLRGQGRDRRVLERELRPRRRAERPQHQLYRAGLSRQGLLPLRLHLARPVDQRGPCPRQQRRVGRTAPRLA